MIDCCGLGALDGAENFGDESFHFQSGEGGREGVGRKTSFLGEGSFCFWVGEGAVYFLFVIGEGGEVWRLLFYCFQSEYCHYVLSVSDGVCAFVYEGVCSCAGF